MAAYLNGVLVWGTINQEDNNIPANGFAAVGTKTFGYAQFDDFKVTDVSEIW